jgi:hypothetical protein
LKDSKFGTLLAGKVWVPAPRMHLPFAGKRNNRNGAGFSLKRKYVYLKQSTILPECEVFGRIYLRIIVAIKKRPPFPANLSTIH